MGNGRFPVGFRFPRLPAAIGRPDQPRRLRLHAAHRAAPGRAGGAPAGGRLLAPGTRSLFDFSPSIYIYIYIDLCVYIYMYVYIELLSGC